MPIASGANSVASALGNRARRDPGTAVRTYHEGRQLTLKTGTFYFGGNRNFLFGPTGCCRISSQLAHRFNRCAVVYVK